MNPALHGPLLATVLFVVLLECALRAAPGLVPLGVLEQYEPSLRASIAASRKLPLRGNTTLAARSDGGPPDALWFHLPETEVTWSLDEPGVERSVRMDGRGFCNPPRPPLEGGAPRADLVAVGDSFTFCSAVAPDATWVARTAAALGLEAENLGMPGRGPYEYVETLRTFGLSLRPKVVVLAVYEGNDLRDAVAFQRGSRGRGRSGSCPSGSLPCVAASWMQELPLVRRSHALGLAPALVRRLDLLARKREIDFRYSVTLPDGSVLPLNSRNGDRDEVEMARALVAGRTTTAVFDGALAALAELARKHGFAPVLLYLPAAYTAYDAVASFDDPGIRSTMRAYSRELRDYFAAASSREGILFLDATDELAAEAARAPAGATPYFPLNVHLTRKGHEVVARSLARFLDARGLLQTATPGLEPGRRQGAGRTEADGGRPSPPSTTLALRDGTGGPSSGTRR